MTLIIEVLQIDNRLSKRITPFFNVVSVYKSYNDALSELYRLRDLYNTNNVSCSIIGDSLVISNDPSRGFAKISYELRNETLYGNHISNTVYNLIRFNGYIVDQDKPYRYDNLGWFCDMEIAKSTKEWKIMRHILSANPLVDEFESDNEIRIYGPYGCCDTNPCLVIKPYEIK